jgi:TctA family transporter
MPTLAVLHLLVALVASACAAPVVQTPSGESSPAAAEYPPKPINIMAPASPGIGPALTVALLLPIAYSLEPTGALTLFARIYYGAMYGGSTTSILPNSSGESASVATTFEGFAMAKSGRGGAALATAAIGSFVAGTISTLLLTFVAPPLPGWP